MTELEEFAVCMLGSLTPHQVAFVVREAARRKEAALKAQASAVKREGNVIRLQPRDRGRA